MAPRIVLLMIDRPADWEYGPLAAAARAWFGLEVISASLGGAALTSLGGLRLHPSHRLEALDPRADAVWAVIGSPLWEQDPVPAPILAALRARAEAGGALAAICGGTRALAAAGVLDGVAHTSNAAGYLDDVPGYRGQAQYRDAACVSEGGVITAPGTSPVRFAQACLRQAVPEQAEGVAQMGAMFAREFE